MNKQMKTTYLLVLALLAALALLVAACAPTGGEPESVAGEPTLPVETGADEEREVEMESNELQGVSWLLVSYLNDAGAQAVTNLMADTTITAQFTEDGKLNGSAGCNNYMTSFTVDGNHITIQPPATTRKLCPEPAGIMEQEAAFVSMLPQSATYTISGNTLELRTADGALVASFAAAP
jgi:heat shock protein HslJ